MKKKNIVIVSGVFILIIFAGFLSYQGAKLFDGCFEGENGGLLCIKESIFQKLGFTIALDPVNPTPGQKVTANLLINVNRVEEENVECIDVAKLHLQSSTGKRIESWDVLSLLKFASSGSSCLKGGYTIPGKQTFYAPNVKGDYKLKLAMSTNRGKYVVSDVKTFSVGATACPKDYCREWSSMGLITGGRQYLRQCSTFDTTCKEKVQGETKTVCGSGYNIVGKDTNTYTGIKSCEKIVVGGGNLPIVPPQKILPIVPPQKICLAYQKLNDENECGFSFEKLFTESGLKGFYKENVTSFWIVVVFLVMGIVILLLTRKRQGGF